MKNKMKAWRRKPKAKRGMPSNRTVMRHQNVMRAVPTGALFTLLFRGGFFNGEVTE